MAKAYEIGWNNLHERALVYVEDGHTYQEVLKWFYYDIDDDDIETDYVDKVDLDEGDFDLYGEEVWGDDDDPIGYIIEPDELVRNYRGMSLEEMLNALNGWHN